MSKAKYEVNINEVYGSCDSELFKKMASKGDITADRIKNVVGKVFNITGYAKCNIVTDDKNFDVVYYATDNGFISSGSQILLDSIVDYIEDTNTFKISEVKTRKGTTYKGVPVFTSESTDMYE